MTSIQLQFLFLQTSIILSLTQCDLSQGFATLSTRVLPQLWKSRHKCRGFLFRDATSGYLRTPSSSCSKKGMGRDGRTIAYNSRQRTDDSVSPQPSLTPLLRVGIIGAGSIAFGTASLASSLGHDPMIWSPSGVGTSELLEHAIDSSSSTAERAKDLISSRIQSTGALAQDFNVRIARSSRELVQFCDNVLVLALPVNGHKKVMEEFAPYLVESIAEQQQQQEPATGGYVPMHIIISSHASLGAVYFMQILREEWRQHLLTRDQSPVTGNKSLNDIGVRITAWGTTVITARKTSGTSVNVLTVRKVVDFCTVPSVPDAAESSQWNQEETLQPTLNLATSMGELIGNGHNLCTALFGPRFKCREGGLLAISLSNLNPQNHLGIVLGNMSRMDPPQPPPPPPEFEQKIADTATSQWYQGQNITPNVGRLMEALDRERLDIAKALDIDVRNIYEHFSWSFHVPIETPVMDNDDGEALSMKMRPLSVSEMNQQMHHYLQNDVLGPASPDSRYVLEDVPYGLVLTVILGRLVDRPAILHEAGIKIISAMYGRDFMVENELLQGLGLVHGDILPSLEKWRDMAYSGCLYD